MELSTIVQVNISRESSGVTQKGFGVPLLIANSPVSITSRQVYTSAQQLLDAGFSTSSFAYLSAAKAFAQSPRLEKIKLYPKSTPVAKSVTLAPVVANSKLYTLVLSFPFFFDVNTFTYTSSGAATAEEIVDEFVSQINDAAALLENPLTASNVGNELVIEHQVAGGSFEYTALPADWAVSDETESVSVVNDLLAMIDEDKDFYLVEAELGPSDFNIRGELATVIESMKRIHAIQLDDTYALNGDAALSEFSLFKNADLGRTFMFYHASATDRLVAGLYGKLLPKNPGSATWKMKQVSGSSADALTDTQAANVQGFNGNIYVDVGGAPMTMEGVMADGEFIDTVIGIDWLEARLQEAVANLFLNTDKVPYTDAGVTLLENAIRPVLENALNVNKLISEYEILPPKVADALPADKAARLLKNLRFSAVFAGAVHKVIIEGTITL